jgi:rRNA maturation RNase YbeY
MHVVVRITQESKMPLEEAFFARIATETIKRCPIFQQKNVEEVSVNAIAVTKEKIQELNRTYRKKDAVTDILSFGEYADTEAIVHEEAPKIFLGELFFCYDFIAEAAQEDEVTVEHEMIYIFSHGILHLLGYDHSPEMFAIQDEVTEDLMQQEHSKE